MSARSWVSHSLMRRPVAGESPEASENAGWAFTAQTLEIWGGVCILLIYIPLNFLFYIFPSMFF